MSNILVIRVPQEKRKCWKYIWWNNGWKCPKFGEKYKPMDSRSWANRINRKTSMARYIKIKLLKTKDKLKILRAAREKWCITYQWTTNLETDFSSVIMKAGGSGKHFSSAKRIVNPGFYIHENILQVWRLNKAIFRRMKAKRICNQQADLLWKNCSKKFLQTIGKWY